MNLYQYKDKNLLDVTNYYDVNKNNDYFLKKYFKQIPNGWYGFSIGTPIVPQWIEIIDEILEECIKSNPNFEIHQIKLKFGSIRFYVYSEIIEGINNIENLITSTLFDEALIY